QVTQLPGFPRPERLQRVGRVRPPLREKIAEPQQMPGLQRVRLIGHYRFKSRNSFQKFILPVISETDVQPDSSHLPPQTSRPPAAQPRAPAGRRAPLAPAAPGSAHPPPPGKAERCPRPLQMRRQASHFEVWPPFPAMNFAAALP